MRVIYAIVVLAVAGSLASTLTGCNTKSAAATRTDRSNFIGGKMPPSASKVMSAVISHAAAKAARKSTTVH